MTRKTRAARGSQRICLRLSRSVSGDSAGPAWESAPERENAIGERRHEVDGCATVSTRMP
jgi:hypothetical protein